MRSALGGAPAAASAAIGCMRLPLGDPAEAVAVVHAALDGGVRLLDTADVYGDAASPHENERLVARALAEWSGPRGDVVVATKGGLRREGAGWFPDGRAKHLVAAAEASALALGGAPLDLWQWHAVDPRVRPATSLRAVATIAKRGIAKAVGICNVTLPIFERALDAFPVAALQIELGPASDGAVRSGVVAAALARGVLVLAHTPLGGAKGAARIARIPAVEAIASRGRATAIEIVLAWISGLHPLLVALPGPTRVPTAASAARAATLELEPADRASLDAAFPRLAALREIGASRTPGASVSPAARTAARPSREVVVLVGSPAAGKSTLVRELARDGYVSLERDAIGGSLDAIAALLGRELDAGRTRLVLDATWPTRAARRPIFEIAARHGASVRAVWLDTSIEDAQINAVLRLVARYGKLPLPEELARLARRDPQAFGPRALFSFRRAFEPPVIEEGFVAVERRPFVRETAHAASDDPPRAVLVDVDGALWSSRSGARAPLDPADIVVDAAVASHLAALAARGAAIWGTSWQPRVAAGEATVEEVASLGDALRARVGFDIVLRVCPHGAGPPVCWCRKPLPGLAVELSMESGTNASSVLAIGRTSLDRVAAARLGMRYLDARTVGEAGSVAAVDALSGSGAAEPGEKK